MFKKISITPHAINYIAAIAVVLIQPLLLGFLSGFIEDAFGSARFVPIIAPLVSVITYSLYFGNSKLSFIVGFLSTIATQIYFIILDFPDSIYFILEFPQTFIASIILGVIFGLVGMLFSIIKRNSGIITRILIHAAMLISVLGIHIIFGRDLDVVGVWLSFNSALMIGLLFSYYVLRDVKKAFLFTFSALLLIFLIIIKSPLNIIFLDRTMPENLFIGIVIAVILAAILMAYNQVHKITS